MICKLKFLVSSEVKFVVRTNVNYNGIFEVKTTRGICEISKNFVDSGSR